MSAKVPYMRERQLRRARDGRGGFFAIRKAIRKAQKKVERLLAKKRRETHDLLEAAQSTLLHPPEKRVTLVGDDIVVDIPAGAQAPTLVAPDGTPLSSGREDVGPDDAPGTDGERRRDENR